MSEEDYTMQITEEGALLALSMHDKIVGEGWSFEEVADYYDYDNVDYIRILLYLLYHMLDQNDINIDEVTDGDIRLLTGN